MTSNEDYLDSSTQWFKSTYPDVQQGIFDKHFDAAEIKYDACKYYDLDAIVQNNVFSNNKISLLHINIRIIHANFDSLIHKIESLNFCFDVIAITESWLDNFSAQLFPVKGCNMFSFPRESDRWDGICFYVKQCFAVNTVNIMPNCGTFEHAELNISANGFQLLTRACYRPSNCSLKDFNDELELYLHTTNAFNSFNINSAILGDFNVNFLHSDSVAGVSTFLNLIYAQGYFPTRPIFKPTRITNHSATLIDNISVNFPNYLDSGLIYHIIADHLPVFVTLQFKNLNSANVNASKPILHKVMNDRVIAKINNKLLNVYWSS